MDKDELIDIWREVVLKNTTNGSCNFQQAAIDFAELVAKPWVETNKALANEIIELQKQAEQEPVVIGSVLQKVMARLADLLDEDQFNNINSIVEGAGYAAPPRTKDLTDEEIWEVVKNCPVDNRIEAAKAAIAADREKNK